MYWAWFGGSQLEEFESEDAFVEQSFIIPAGDSATLTFWLWIANADFADEDTFVVSLDDDDLLDATIENTGGYQQFTIDVSAYADGGTHTLSFVSYVESLPLGVTSISLDDVSLTVETATPTPTPTATPVVALKKLRRS